MKRKFIGIETRETIIPTNNILRQVKRMKKHLILDGYNTHDNTKINDEFNQTGHAISLEPIHEIDEYKSYRNKKIRKLVILFLILFISMTYLIFELKLKYLITKDCHKYIIYVAIGLLIFILLYIELKIAKDKANAHLKDNAIERQFENKENWIFEQSNYNQDKNTRLISKTLLKNEYHTFKITQEQNNHNYNDHYITTKYDIEKLDDLYLKYKSKYNYENDKITNEFYEYLKFFLEEKSYISKTIKNECNNLLKECETSDNAKKLEIANDIMYKIFNDIHSYKEYTSIGDFILHGIFGLKDKKEIKSELYEAKIEEVAFPQITKF